MDNDKIILGLFLTASAAAGIYWYTRQGNTNLLPAYGAGSGTDSPGTVAESGGIIASAEAAVKTAIGWITPSKGQVYEAVFAAAEKAYSLPSGMLSRVAYQESRYNPNAKSPVGALGLMQFMPATAKDFGIDPLDPVASIWAAGKYLSQLYRQFGTWDKALAAYNWGQGNVSRKGLDKAPTETRNYFTSILADLGLDNVMR